MKYIQVLLLTLAASASAIEEAIAQPAVAAFVIRATAAPVAGAIVPRADADSCTTSFLSLASNIPTPTDKDLSSFLDSQPDSTFAVPSSVQKQYCTFQASNVAWFSSAYLPFQKACSALGDFPTTTSVTVESWCASVTKNVAGPRETKGALAIVAAAGIAVAMI